GDGEHGKKIGHQVEVPIRHAAAHFERAEVVIVTPMKFDREIALLFELVRAITFLLGIDDADSRLDVLRKILGADAFEVCSLILGKSTTKLFSDSLGFHRVLPANPCKAAASYRDLGPSVQKD